MTMEDKKQIRKRIRDIRSNLSPEEVKEKSIKIFNNLINLKEYKEAEKIYAYVSTQNEADTIMLIDYSLLNEKRVFLPRVNGSRMDFYEISDITELSPGAFGIYEPDIEGKEPDYSRTGLLIMPGVAFDSLGNRIGFGGGFYDKYLSEGGRFLKIALAYDFQILENLPAEEHDEKTDIVVTENTIYMNTY